MPGSVGETRRAWSGGGRRGSGRVGRRAAGLARGVLGVAAALVVLASFLWVGTRFLRTERAAAEQTEIVLLHWGDAEEAAVVATLVASFERANPDVRVKRINGGANYFAKLQTMVAAGDPPDVFFLNAYLLPKYVPAGVIRPLDDLFERDASRGELGFEREDMFGEVLSGFRYDGERLGDGPLYGVPMSFTPMGFYYNRSLFEEAGVAPPSAGWTWDDFERKARAVAEATGARAAVDLRGAQLWRLMAWGEGSDIVTPGFERAVDDAALGRATARLASWGDEPSAFRVFGAADQGVETGTSLFQSGSASMQGPVGRWMVPTYRRITGFEWDWAPLPRSPREGAEPRNMLYIAAWCVAAGSEHPEEAWRVAKHFATPEGQEINAGLGLALPTLRSVAAGPSFTDPGTAPASDEAFLRAVPGSAPMLWPTQSRLTRDIQNIAFDAFHLDKADPAGAPGEVQRAIDRLARSRLATAEYAPMRWGVAIALAGVPLVAAAGWWFIRWWRGLPQGMARRREVAGLAMTSPWLIGFALFIAGPMLISLLLGFTRWSALSTLDQAEWVGLQNYREMVFDARVLHSLRITGLYALLAVPLGQLAALAAALLMTQPVRGVNAFRSLWYLPSVLAGAAMAVMWFWVFDSEFGLLNAVLGPVASAAGSVFTGVLGEPPAWWGEAWFAAPAWLERDAATWGVPAFAIASLWNFGAPMLIYIAGLQAIPTHLAEAAKIDGARGLRRFWSITLPMLSPVVLFNVIIAIIGSFQVFTLAFIMTRGGPGDDTMFFVLLLYLEAFESHNMGYSSAMAWVLLAIVMVLTVVSLRLSRSRVHQGGLGG